MCETACNDKAQDEKCCRCLSQTTGEFARRVLEGNGQGWSFPVAEFYDAVLESSRDWEPGVHILDGSWDFLAINGFAPEKRHLRTAYVVGRGHVRVLFKDKRFVQVDVWTRTNEDDRIWSDRVTMGVFEAGREKESWAPILACIQEACEACGLAKAAYLLK